MAKLIPSPLYHPDQEHDACGVGFIARMTGERSYDVINRAVAALKALAHRENAWRNGVKCFIAIKIWASG